MRYRNRTEIISQILEIANGGSSDDDGRVTKTKIMYKAFLGHAQLKEYLMILTGNDLLGYDIDTQSRNHSRPLKKVLDFFKSTIRSTMW
jgi:predicted transcriptional regulator